MNTKETGNMGEDIACEFLISKGYQIIDRNYTKRWGEIDIVATLGDIYWFIEVKTVARETISRETLKPEEHVTREKIERQKRIILSYLADKKLENEEWKYGVVAITLIHSTKEAHLKFLQNIIFE